MIQRTIELALSVILIVTSIAVALAIGSFMITGYGYITQQSYGSISNLFVVLGITLVSSLLLIGQIKLAQPWICLRKEQKKEESQEVRIEVPVETALQTKKGSTSAN